MIDDRTLEHRITTVYGEIAPPREPEGLLDDVLLATSSSRQRPEWLALIKEPTMRTNSHLAVGSPTARVAALMVATLLAALMIVGAGIAGSRLLAADSVLVVDQSGGGDFTTISEAVAVAEDGASILVKAGVYSEAVTITKDILLEGEERDGVVIEIPCVDDLATGDLSCAVGTPMYDVGEGDEDGMTPFAMALDGSDAEIRGITVRSPAVGPLPFIVDSGAPTIEGVASVQGDGGISVLIRGSSAATLRGSTLDGSVSVEGQGRATIDGNIVAGSIFIDARSAPAGEGSVVRRNRAEAIELLGPVLVEGNDVRPPAGEAGEGWGSGIAVHFGEGWVVRDNVVTGQDDAAITISFGDGTIVGNELRDNGTGISLGPGSTAVEGNTVVGGSTGISILSGSPSVVGNTIEGVSGRAISVAGTASPMVSGNTMCGNGEDLYVSDTATPVIGDDNVTCPA